MVQVGFDIDGNQARVARVSNDLGRPIVDHLERLKLEDIPGQPWLNSGSPLFSVGDELTQVKALNLSLTSQMSYREAGRFELARSVLDNEREFLFATYPTQLGSNYVGTICRLKKAREISDTVGLAPRNGYSSDSFIPRAAALGAGYLTYCQTEPGELTGLIDLAERTGSICLVYRGQIVSIGYMPLDRSTDTGNLNPKQTVVQAKTMFNLLTSRLASNGLNLPMATLILTGGETVPDLKEQFERLFICGVTTPRPNRSYLSDRVADREDLSAFLVAMGLAFNSLAR